MKITAFCIVRNEEVLIAKHIMHLATLADDVLVVVQPSTDSTLMFAKDCAGKCFAKVKVIEHAPENLGWEFSLKKVCEEASHDWLFGLTADETYCGAGLHSVVRTAKKRGYRAAAICRLHAVSAGKDEYFKVEDGRPELRLFHREAKTSSEGKLADFDIGWNRSLNHAFNGKACTISPTVSRILRYRPAWAHIREQLSLATAGVTNELAQCEVAMPPKDIRLGRTMYERTEG